MPAKTIMGGGVDSRRCGAGVPPPGKSQVAMGTKCILRNTGTDPPREAIGPPFVQLLLEGSL